MAEEKNKTLRITLHVYDNEIPLTVLREDEAYMALINIAFQYAREARRNDTEPFHEILRKLTSEVEAALA